MTTTMIESNCNIPPILSERETQILGTNVRAACFDALACADMSYHAAGISFVQDGRFTKAKVRGHTVAALIGRFSKGLLIQTIRDNIAESARDVGTAIFPNLKSDLTLPSDHVIGFDLDADLYQVARRGSQRLTAYIFQVPGSTAPSFFGEIHVDLHKCQASLSFKEGERWNCGRSMLDDEIEVMTADTYEDLCILITAAFNKAATTIGNRK